MFYFLLQPLFSPAIQRPILRFAVRFQFEECCPGLLTWALPAGYFHCRKLQSHGGVEFPPPSNASRWTSAHRDDDGCCCCCTLNRAHFCFLTYYGTDGFFKERQGRTESRCLPACHWRGHPSLGQPPEPCLGVNLDRCVLLGVWQLVSLRCSCFNTLTRLSEKQNRNHGYMTGAALVILLISTFFFRTTLLDIWNPISLFFYFIYNSN